jgi:hypothetical protein
VDASTLHTNEGSCCATHLAPPVLVVKKKEKSARASISPLLAMWTDALRTHPSHSAWEKNVMFPAQCCVANAEADAAEEATHPNNHTIIELVHFV